jgi:HK97 family phage prohead protease
MEKIFSLTSTFKALEPQEDGSVLIRGMASTADFDRAGDVISAEAWTKGGLENFKRNPIILFNHNYDKPIGRATGFKTGPNGLELEAKISKAAPDSVAQLVKDGVLGAFSVGFRVKDADYIKETDGLLIKDAELFEVSVVSVPCNQSATFSLSKSFDSIAEYEAFKKTFINRVDLAGQSMAKEDVIASSVASDTPEKMGKKPKVKETKMSDQIDLEAFAKRVADETATKIALKQAEEKAAVAKAAEEAAAKKAQEEQARVTFETGAEKLQKDLEARFAEKDAKFDEIVAAFKTELEEKTAELSKIRDSKRVFSDRGSDKDLTKFGKDFLYGHMLGVMTGKGWNTKFGSGVLQKAGIDYTTNAGDIDQEVSRLIEKEVTLELRTAGLFREIPVNSAATVLPIQPDVDPAVFQTGAASSGNLENRGASDSTFKVSQVILNAYRLISQTFMDNNIDEQVLVNLMPMLVESVARAHARAVDNAIVNGSGSITGLDGYATANTAAELSLADGDVLTAAKLLSCRQLMGKYGVRPSDVAYIVSQNRYFELIEDTGFADITDVGSDVATKITGAIGAVYGSPVIVSDSFATEANGVPAAFAVNLRNFVIPRLRGVTVETDYEVGNQRRVIVATQSLGFEELVADAAGNYSSVKIDIVT